MVSGEKRGAEEYGIHPRDIFLFFNMVYRQPHAASNVIPNKKKKKEKYYIPLSPPPPCSLGGRKRRRRRRKRRMLKRTAWHVAFPTIARGERKREEGLYSASAAISHPRPHQWIDFLHNIVFLHKLFVLRLLFFETFLLYCVQIDFLNKKTNYMKSSDVWLHSRGRRLISEQALILFLLWENSEFRKTPAELGKKVFLFLLPSSSLHVWKASGLFPSLSTPPFPPPKKTFRGGKGPIFEARYSPPSLYPAAPQKVRRQFRKNIYLGSISPRRRERRRIGENVRKTRQQQQKSGLGSLSPPPPQLSKRKVFLFPQKKPRREKRRRTISLFLPPSPGEIGMVESGVFSGF